MKYVGVDLHKKALALCVVTVEEGKRRVVERKRLACHDVAGIEGFFQALGAFQVVVEATASYEWFVKLVEPHADRVVIAHPGKLRIIAESTRKTDKLDAQALAEFLALGMIPESHRPSPRVREHRALVRQRSHIQRRITSVKNKLRRVLADYNADVKHLFTVAGREHLENLALSAADRFVTNQLTAELDHYQGQLHEMDRRLKEFAAAAPAAEREARAVLATMPGVGKVTVDVVLSELGDVRRFRSQKQVMAYAGLAPRVRESAGRSKQQGITKQGSRLLRWAMVELAWRMTSKTRRWGLVFEQLKRRAGPKKAIVAVARRLMGVVTALLRSGKRYSLATEALG